MAASLPSVSRQKGFADLTFGTIAVPKPAAHINHMTLRNSWTRQLLCAGCGNSGAALISEIDAPLIPGEIDRTIDYCPPGFTTMVGNTSSKQQQIVCLECGTVVYGPKMIIKRLPASRREAGFDGETTGA